MNNTWDKFKVDEKFDIQRLIDIDLQVHSFFSDGVEAPADLVKQAGEKKLQDFAITDHSSVLAYTSELFELAKSLNVTLRPGIEIEVAREVDVLVYNTDLDQKFDTFKTDVNAIIPADIQARISKAEKTITDIKAFLQDESNQPSWLLWKTKTDAEKEELLSHFSLENAQRVSFKTGEIDTQNRREYVGKPHIAFLLQKFNLIDWGAFASAYQISDKGKLMKKSYKVLFEEISQWPDDQNDEKIGEQVSKLGYIKILAHPGKTFMGLHDTFDHDLYMKFVTENLQKYNLDGAECFYRNYDESEFDFNKLTTELLLKLSKDTGKTYYGTGGTDSHGKLK